MPESHAGLVEENERLKARIGQLEAQLNQRSKARVLDPVASERAKDLPSQFVDEASRALRAFTLAGVEATRRHGEILVGFAEEVLEKNRPTPDSPNARDLAMNLPREVVSAAVNAIDGSLKMQKDIVDKFAEAFRETPVPEAPSKR